MLKKDISTPEDVKTLVDAFYNDVKSDSVIGYIFTDVAKVDWEEHLPKNVQVLGICTYWAVLFTKATP